MPITREGLRNLGISVPPEGGLATRSSAEDAKCDRCGGTGKCGWGSDEWNCLQCGGTGNRVSAKPKREEREPLAEAIIAGIVESHPRPTRDPVGMPRVLGCDPSLNEAGFALVGGPWREVRTAAYRSKRDAERGEKVLALARFAIDFALSGFAADWVVVEGTYLDRGVSPASIVALGEAVGAVQGALGDYEVLRVEPDWMPDLLMLHMAGGSSKQDRHRVARGLLERSGIAWPEHLDEKAHEHEADATCLAVARLVTEGWV